MALAAADALVVRNDRADWLEKHRVNAVELIVHAARRSGRSPFAIGLESLKFKRSPARLRLEEYVEHRLYDPAAHTEEERRNFISMYMHRAVINAVNDPGWTAVTEDKWLSQCLLAADGVPVPRTLAVVDASARAFHGVGKIAAPEDLRAFLTSPDTPLPIFGKFNNGKMSVGVFTITGADEAGLELRDRGRMSYEEFFSGVVGNECFLLQEVVKNHAFLSAYTETTATVRMVNMLTDDGLRTPAAVLKLPSSRNQADNFWREGNLLCNLDPETGEILRVVGHEGFDLVEHDLHPETGQPLLGRRLPHWDRLREVNERVAFLHTPLRYQSTDIAITDAGPVVIEVNNGSCFSIPQAASGKGFMTPEIRRLFRAWGAEMIWE